MCTHTLSLAGRFDLVIFVELHLSLQKRYAKVEMYGSLPFLPTVIQREDIDG